MAAQKLFAPFKKIPQQVQNLPLIKKALEAKHGKRHSELFGCHLSSTFGYPEQPSALAYDPTLKIIAIGTHRGDLKILGAAGVEFSAVHANCDEVCRIVFIPNEGRLITLTGDNKLHFWEFDDVTQPPLWKELKTLDLTENADDREGARVTAFSLSQDSETLFVGTESGLLQKVHVKEWKLDDESVNTEAVASGLEESKRGEVKFGEIVAVEAHPTDKARLLIGYSEGLVVLYNAVEAKATHYFPKEHALESVTWCSDGAEAVASYCDGSFLVWKVTNSEGGVVVSDSPPNTPYGPFPCEAIKKVVQKKSDKFGNLTVFTGGMPKTTYSGRHTVSVMGTSEHVCFDFTSQVIDFVTVDSPVATPEPIVCNGDATESTEEKEETPKTALEGSVGTLLVMLEHEIVAIDLTKEGWPMLDLPYLSCINTSYITAMGQAEAVSAEVMSLLETCSERSSIDTTSWPILGGEDKRKETSGDSSSLPACTDLLLTGHEDGSVALWKLGYGDVFHKLTTVPTASLYDAEATGQTEQKNDEDEAWPPFRRVGKFQPATEEDVRLCVTRVQLTDTTLVVGGMAGQASVWKLAKEKKEVEIDVLKIGADLIEDRDRFEWKSAGALKVHEGSQHFKAGFQPEVLVQVEPPSEVTAIAFQSLWDLLAVGTAHGFVVVDTRQKRVVFTHATVFDTHEIQPHALLVKGRKLQTSMRQSFRRLRKMVPRPGQSTAAAASTEDDKKKETSATATEGSAAEGEAGTAKEEVTATEGETPAATEEKKEETVATTEAAAEPIVEAAEKKDEKKEAVAEGGEETTKKEGEEKKETVEASVPEPAPPLILSSGDVTTALIRCLLFTETFIVSPHERVASLWLGSQAGCTYILSITLPAPGEDRDTTEIKAVLSKELSLQHGAPVVGIAVIDAKTRAPVTVLDRSTEAAAPKSTELPKEEPAASTTEGTTSAATETTPVATTAATPSRSNSTMEHHEVVICSEEQVKIFSLPNLKPKHKYKVLTDKSVSIGASGGDQEARTGTIDRPQLTKTATIDRCPTDDTAAARHRIKSFGVQRFRHASVEEWDAVIALADGLFYILSLPSLRKQFTASFTPDKESFMPMTCVGHSDANVVMTLSGAGQVRVTDVSQQLPSHYGALCILPLPEGARPVPAKPEEPAAPAIEETAVAATEIVEGGLATVDEEANEVKELGFSVDGLEPVTEEASEIEDAAATAKAEAKATEAAIEAVAKDTVETTIVDAQNEVVAARDEALEAKALETVEGAIKEAKQELMSREEPVNNVNNVSEGVDEDASSPSQLKEAPAADEITEVKKAVEEVSEKLENSHIDDGLTKTSQHIGDITMDSIKEYTNNDDDVTVKTFSSTKTVEETVTKVIEEHGGKIIMDDIVKTVESSESAPAGDVTAGGE